MKLNNQTVKEIQDYLRSMNWAQREYKGELLTAFLRGVECALWEDGITFRLMSQRTETYETEFYVAVEQYEDYTDCWSDKETLGFIRENVVEWRIVS